MENVKILYKQFKLVNWWLASGSLPVLRETQITVDIDMAIDMDMDIKMDISTAQETESVHLSGG